MSFVKTHLKAARDSITKKDYPNAKKEAALVLDFEPENYNACVNNALMPIAGADMSPYACADMSSSR